MQSVEAYPLHWPPHRKRTQCRSRAKFHRKIERTTPSGGSTYQQKQSLTIADSRDRLYRELESLGGKKAIISSNLQVKLDGTPYGNQGNPVDPGVAVYFELNKQPHCLSCDAWDRAADNLAAIAKHVEAMRGQLRWGVADVASMFSGFKALPGAIITPAPMTIQEAEQFICGAIGGRHESSRLLIDPEAFKYAYRAAAMRLHPDTGEGGNAWNELQRAAEVLKQHHGIA